MISVRGFLYFIGQLRPRFIAKAQRAQECRVDRANAVELRLLFEDLLQDFRGLDRFPVIVERASTKGFDQRMIRFDRGALIKFGERVIVSSLISENARAIVTGHNSFGRIQSRHALITTQRFLVIAIKPGQHTAHKVNSDVVGRFASQLLRGVAGFLFLAARKID